MRKKLMVFSCTGLLALAVFFLQWFLNIRVVQHVPAADGVLDLRGKAIPSAFLVSNGWQIYDGTVYPEKLTDLTPQSGAIRLYGNPKTYRLEIIVDEICALSLLDSSRCVSGISVGKPYIYSAYIRPDTLVNLTGESSERNLWRKLPDGYSFEIVLQTDFSDPAQEYFSPPVLGDAERLKSIANSHIIFGSTPLGALLIILVTSLALYTNQKSERYLLLMALEAFFALFWCLCKFTSLGLASNHWNLALERAAYAGMLAGIFLLCSSLAEERLSPGSKAFVALGGLSALLALLPFAIIQNLPHIHLYLCEPMLQASVFAVMGSCSDGDRRTVPLLCGVVTFDAVHLYALLADLGAVPANVSNILFDTMLFAVLLMTLSMMLYTSRHFSRSHIRAAELNRELTELNETLAERVSEKTADLQEALSSLVKEQNKNNELMTHIFHNLRSPLFAIRGYSDILLKTASGETQSVLRRVQSNAEYLCRMSEDLFLCARLQEHHIELNILTTDVTELIEQMLSSLAILAQQENVQLRCGHTGAVYADCDPFQTQTILRNLLENSIRFSPEGGTVTVTAEQLADKAVIRVRDEGRGIEDTEKIFERGYTGADRKVKSGSTGLGLYLSRSLAQLHGGALYAKNVSPGAEFILELPAQAPAEVQPASEHTAPH